MSSSGTSDCESPAFFFSFFLVPLLLIRYGTLTCRLRIHVRLVLPLLNVPLGTETLAEGETGNNWVRGLKGAEPWPSGTVTTCGSVSYKKKNQQSPKPLFQGEARSFRYEKYWFFILMQNQTSEIAYYVFAWDDSLAQNLQGRQFYRIPEIFHHLS